MAKPGNEIFKALNKVFYTFYHADIFSQTYVNIKESLKEGILLHEK